jgi:hypothetical protein
VSDKSTHFETAARLGRALGAGYQVRGLVGRGGFAEVYEVLDRELERRLAIKVLRPDIAWTSGMLQRFKQETRTVAKLQHPNILAIHFVGEGEGLVYYAMPYIEGTSLGGQLRDSGTLSPRRALDIAIPVLEALQHAHEHGLVHRDIKPDNIMIDTASGRPLLVDFGIAKRLDADGSLTQTGYVVGTPYYMSPEQALGQKDLDARSDLYAFGAVLFQMVTGSPPFEGETSQEIVGKHLAEPPPLPSDVNADVPLWLSQVITRCLAKKPNDRFQAAAAVADALRAGRETAPATPHALERAKTNVDTAAATEVVESEKRLSAAAPTPARRRRLALMSLPLIAVLAFAGMWLLRPRLVFENHLVAPVELSLGGQRYVVGAGERITLALPRGEPSDVLWTLEQPTTSDGTSIGAEVFGAITLPNPRGRIRRSATATPSDRDYFAPLITNNTGQPLTITVNAGSGAAMSCNCTVPSGAVRMVVGYYPLYQNSTVRVEDSGGRSAMFTELGGEVDRQSGVVGLRFEAADLQ